MSLFRKLKPSTLMDVGLFRHLVGRIQGLVYFDLIRDIENVVLLHQNGQDYETYVFYFVKCDSESLN